MQCCKMKSVHHTSALLAIKFADLAITAPARHCKGADNSPHLVDTVDFFTGRDADIPNIPSILATRVILKLA